MALLGRQGRVLPDLWDTATLQVAVLADKVVIANEVLVEQGRKLHDREEYAKAIAAYAQALQVWPQSGWAWYELGQTIMISGLSPDYDDSETEGSGATGDSAVLTELSDAEAYLRPRHHDPFLWQAYQGKAEQVELLRVVVGDIIPTWQRFQSDPQIRQSMR